VSDDVLRPRAHAEEIALFRAEVIGALARRELSHGELTAEIRKLAKLRFRPPGRHATKVSGCPDLDPDNLRDHRDELRLQN
jgi:putative transposase